MNSKYAITGKWTSPPVYDAEKNQTVLTNANANFPAGTNIGTNDWANVRENIGANVRANAGANLCVSPSPGNSALCAKSLSGKLINADSSQYLQSLIISNTETRITVSGDAASFANINDAYKIIDYHPEYKSGAIDSAGIK